MCVVERAVNGMWKENCYVVSNKKRECVIIDPGSDGKKIINYIGDNKLDVLAILNTHGHYDHIGAVEMLRKRLNVPFYLHSADMKIMKKANLYLRLFDGSNNKITIPEVDNFVDKVKIPIELGNFRMDVLYTPGHTPGGVCYMLEGCLFSGDTLFKNGIGRVDLPGGDMNDLLSSLKRLRDIPSKTKLYPGHGEVSTIGEEIKNNEELLRGIK
ncbi:MBL fold metallo-hydrolase [Candidatus Woesearchaeota archaeon]|nr:MBL fold metallo-hydrolase [Candidatus Woesearchaeota archaeon]